MNKKDIKIPKARPLFGPGSKIEEVKIPEVEIPTVEIPKVIGNIVESEIDGWKSQYAPDEPTDRFILISPDNERFACKFYNRITNDFVGSSMLSMYNLRDHYDRSIIPDEEGR